MLEVINVYFSELMEHHREQMRLEERLRQHELFIQQGGGMLPLPPNPPGTGGLLPHGSLLGVGPPPPPPQPLLADRVGDEAKRYVTVYL